MPCPALIPLHTDVELYSDLNHDALLRTDFPFTLEADVRVVFNPHKSNNTRPRLRLDGALGVFCWQDMHAVRKERCV